MLLVIGGRAFAITTYVHLMQQTGSIAVAALTKRAKNSKNGKISTITPIIKGTEQKRLLWQHYDDDVDMRSGH